MSSQVIPVGLGELKAAREPSVRLVCYGLGSCIGVTAYDSRRGVAALAHVVLPDSNLARRSGSPGRFADTALPALLEAVERLGGRRENLAVKLVGGARVLRFGPSAQLDIGARNIDAVRLALSRLGLHPVAEDIGGNHGRTVHLLAEDGRVVVSTVGRGEREL